MSNEAKIRELARKQVAGEISQEEYEAMALEIARQPEEVESHNVGVDEPFPFDKVLEAVGDVIERNPRLALAVMAGFAHGAKTYLRSE